MQGHQDRTDAGPAHDRERDDRSTDDADLDVIVADAREPAVMGSVTPSCLCCAAHMPCTTHGPHDVAADGFSGSGGALPHREEIQRSFGRFDVSNVLAHVGGAARRAAEWLGANSYAMGNRVAFASAPSLHAAAHEAAHVVQQRSALQLEGGVGQVGDAHEQHAVAVADRVVRGESAESLLLSYGAEAATSPSKALQFDKNVTAREYYYANGSPIGYTAETVVKSATFSTHTAMIQWWGTSMQTFADGAAWRIRHDPYGGLESLVRPEQITTLVDRSRVREIDPHAGAVGTKGPDTYFPAVGVEVGNALVRRISESLQRMLPRWVVARRNGKLGDVRDVVTSHPIDRVVADALGALPRGSIWVSNDYHPVVPTRSTPRTTTLTPEGKSGMWFRLVSPADATLEEIARALLDNDPDEAFRIEDARPLFGIRPDTRGGKGQDIDPGEVLVKEGGTLLEEVALAEAGTSKTARPATEILEQMVRSAQVLRTSMRDAAAKFGLGRTTEAAAARIDARVARLRKAGDTEVAKWDRHAAIQAWVIEEAGKGLVADIARLVAYGAQYEIDLAADPGAFKLPDAYRRALREDAELWVNVIEVSDVPVAATQRMHTASSHSMTVDVEILERSLDAARDASLAAKSATKTTLTMGAGTLEKREEEKRLELAKLRSQLLADPTKIDQAAATKTSDESRDLIFESQIVSNAAALEEAWKALDDVDGWIATVTRDEPMIDYLKREGKRYSTRWFKIYADFKAGLRTQARLAFEALIAEDDFRVYLGKVQKIVTRAAKRARWVKLFAVVLIMVASMAAGTVVSGVVTGLLGAGTDAAAFGVGTMQAIGHVTRFVGMTAAMTWLENRLFSKDHSLKEYLGELGKNIVLFGVLEGLGILVRASGVAKIFETGKKLDTPAMLLKKGTNEVAEMILVGGVGVAFAYVEAKVQAALANRNLTDEQTREIVEDNIIQTIVFTVVGRLMASPLKSLQVQTQYQTAKWKAATEGWYAQRDWLNRLGTKPKLDVVAQAAARDRAQAQREIDALEELKKTAKDDPDALAGTKLDPATIDASIATLRTQQQRLYAFEMGLSLKQLGPNHFAVPRSKMKAVLATVKNGADAKIEATDASGARTYKVPPENAGDLPLRLVEDIPTWQRGASGKQVLATAKQAGVHDVIEDVPPSQADHLVQANDAHKNGEKTVQYHLEQAGLDVKTRDAMLRIYNVENVRKNAVEPAIGRGLDKLEGSFSKENVAKIIEKVPQTELESYLQTIESSGLKPGEIKSAGVDFFYKLAESQRALRFARRYGLKLTLNLSRRYGWQPGLDAAFDAIDSRASADFEGTRSWREQLEGARDLAKVEALFGKAKPPRAKLPRRSAKDLPVDRNPDEWETKRLEVAADMERRGKELTTEQLELHADCEVFFDLAKDLQFRNYKHARKVGLLDTFDKVAKLAKMPQSWINAHRGVISEALFNPGFGRPKPRFLNKQLVEGPTPEGATIPDYHLDSGGRVEYVNQKSHDLETGKRNAEGVFSGAESIARDHLRVAQTREAKNLPDDARYSLDYVREPNAATIEAVKEILFKDGVTIYRVKFGETWHTNPKYKGP